MGNDIYQKELTDPHTVVEALIDEYYDVLDQVTLSGSYRTRVASSSIRRMISRAE